MDRERKLRCANRVPAEFVMLVRWTDDSGLRRFAESRGVDLSRSGARILLREPISPGTPIQVEAHQFNVSGAGLVRYCTRRGNLYSIGIQFGTEAASSVLVPAMPLADYYETMQIGPNADPNTVHRVYRILAARYHPDNSESGDPERYRQLTDAYRVLGDPSRREEYDLQYARRELKPLPIFSTGDFADDVAGEANRRLGIVCLLYNQRRRRAEAPGVSVLHLEVVMSLPREHLCFALWYLKEKRLISMMDNSDIALTAAGVDWVESLLPGNALAARLLTPPKEVSSRPIEPAVQPAGKAGENVPTARVMARPA